MEMPGMQAKPHLPTLVYALIGVVLVVGLYHLARKKG